MIIKWKKLHKDATQPTQAYPSDAGWDFKAVDFENEDKIITYKTGIAIAIPESHVGLLFPRSSVYKKDVTLANSVGVIDAGFRGEILFKFRKTQEMGILYTIGDRIGQLMIIPIPDFFWDESIELPESVRDTKGHGSSDLISQIKGE